MSSKLFPVTAALLLLAAITLVSSCNNDSSDDPTPCDSTDVSFSTTIQPILVANCYNGCHNGSSPTSGFLLDSYAGVKAKVDQNRLYGAVAHLPGFSAMPQGGGKLSDCQISQIKAWIDEGAKNN
jgi:hypothetical protein